MYRGIAVTLIPNEIGKDDCSQLGVLAMYIGQKMKKLTLANNDAIRTKAYLKENIMRKVELHCTFQ